jgi:glycerate kinase
MPKSHRSDRALARSVLFCPTAFKGTLSPGRAADAMRAASRVAGVPIRVAVCPTADGGDGTLEVLARAWKARRIRTWVRGPLGRRVNAEWALCERHPGGRTAIIEMARASGLALTGGKNRIMDATSEGTGQLIRAALDRGARTIVIGVGGTATGEGGAGALAALGLRLYDGAGRSIGADPRSLVTLARVDRRGLDPRLKRTAIRVVCDVTNPLLGPRGSARTFGPQKGATPAQVRVLERALRRWSRFAPRRRIHASGAGAAGALAYGLAAFAGARLVPGSRFVFDAIDWNRVAARSDLIVTGEGRLDATSFGGKVIGEVVRRSKAPVAAVCGSSALSAAAARKRGLMSVETMGSAGFRNPPAVVRAATVRLLKRILNSRKDQRS